MTPRKSPPPPPKPNKARLFIGGMLALVLLGGAAFFLNSGGENHAPTAELPKASVPKVTPIPPPVVEPKIDPPKPLDPPLKKQMVIQEPIDISEPVPQPPQLPPAASQPVSTTIEGPGELSLGPGGEGGPGGPEGPTIGGPGKGGKWDFYAAKVQETIKATLSHNPRTKNAAFSMEVRVWADANGRITKATLVGTSGNSAVDAAIKSQVLTGQLLPEPPPADMPMPINMLIAARRSI